MRRQRARSQPGRAAPEPVELEVVELDVVPLDVGPLDVAPLDLGPERCGAAVVVETMAARSGRWLVSLDIGHRPDQRGTEFTVRRRIHAGIDAAVPAVVAAIRDARVSGPSVAPARRRPARLELQLEAARHEHGVLRIPARLRGGRLPRPVPVEIDVEPWSAAQSELRLQARRRHGHAHPSARYFDAAHDVLDALRAAAEAKIVDGFRAPAS